MLNDYANHRFCLSLTPVNRWGRWLVPLLPSLKTAQDVKFRHLPRAGKPLNLLDIGCGNGEFLSYAATAGHYVTGIDIDPKAVAACQARELNVISGGIDSLRKLSSGQFDYITASHIIEHVHQPRLMLKEAFRLLRSGGTLWLETPNLESCGHSRFKKAWRDLDVPRHLVLFNRKSLWRLLVKNGFTSIVQKNRGLTTFAVFAASEAIVQGENALLASRSGKPPMWDILTEIYEIVCSKRREYLTLTAKKPVA
jgi:SAM-dependent methyltransferase